METMVRKTVSQSVEFAQAKKYSKAELANLKDFVCMVQDDKERALFVCWGNHSEYTKGY